MNNTRFCIRCKKTLIAEEYEGHYCHPHFKDAKTIIIDYYFEVKNDENDDKIIIAKGLDGILYRLIHCLHNPPHQPTGNTDKSTDNETAPKTGCCQLIGL